MKRLLTILLLIVSANVFGQLQPQPSGTLTPLTTNQAYFRDSDSTYYFYNGTNYLWNYFLNKQQADKLYSPIGTPTTTPFSLSTGYGLVGSSFDGSVARTWTADTASAGGLVSKSRLATNLGGYVPSSRTITINGATRDLSTNRVWNVGTVTSVGATAGTGISVTGSPITSSGNITITNTAPDQTVVLTAGTGISTSGTYPNFTITNTSPSPSGLQDSLTKKANRTFDNVASGAIANVKLANSTISGVALGSNLNTLTLGNGLIGTSYNGSSAVTARVDTTAIQTVANFFPKGDTRWAKSVTVQDSLNTRVKKSGDTMTGTLNAPDINLSGTLFGKRIDVRTGERLLLWNQTDGDYWSLKNNHDTLDFSKTFDRKAYMLQNGSLVLGDNLSSTGLFLRTAPTTVSGNQYIAVRDSTNGLIKQMRSDGFSGFGTGYVRNQFSAAQPSSWFWISGFGAIDGRPDTYTPSLKIGTNSNIATQTGVSVNINYTPTNNETAHAFSDGSDYSIKGKAYNSLNLAPTFSGSDVSQVTDHYIGTQITPATIDTTRFDHVYGVEFQPYLTKASGNTIAGLHVGTIGGTWANKYAVKSDASDVDILIAGRSRSGGLNTSGNMVSTYSGTSPIITNTSGTTNVQYLDFANTGGRFWLGNNNSAGSSLPGSTAYATVLTTVGAQPLQLGTNGTIRQTISSSGGINFSSTSGSGDVIVGSNNAGDLGKITIGSGLSLSSGVLTATGGSSGSVTTAGGTSGKIAKFTSASNIENSIMTESGTDIGISGSLSASTSISANSGKLLLKQDGTYGSGYSTISFGGTGVNGDNRIFGGNDLSDDLFVAAGTSKKVILRANGSTGDVATFAGSAITFNQALSATSGTFSGSLSASNLSGTNTGDQNLAPYALLNSPTFTGTPTLPTGTIAVTQTQGDNSTKVATTAYVDNASTSSSGNKQLDATYTTTGSTTSGNTILDSYTVSSANFTNPGDKINFEYSGRFAVNNNLKETYIYINGDSFKIHAHNTTSLNRWTIKGYIILESFTEGPPNAYSSRVVIEGSEPGNFSNPYVDSILASVPPVIQMVGNSTGANNDITLWTSSIWAQKAP